MAVAPGLGEACRKVSFELLRKWTEAIDLSSFREISMSGATRKNINIDCGSAVTHWDPGHTRRGPKVEILFQQFRPPNALSSGEPFGSAGIEVCLNR
jgi:hypothetical protein